MGPDVLPSLAGLVEYTVMTYNEGLHPLSPYAYWWRDGRLTELTRIDRTGLVDYQVSPEFADAVTRLAGDPAA